MAGTLESWQSNVTMEVLVIGSSAVDVLVFPNRAAHEKSVSSRIELAPGGVGYNMAQFLAEKGHFVTFLSSMGDDPFARFLCSDLHPQCDLRLIKAAESASKTAVFVGLAQDFHMTGYSDLRAFEAAMSPEAILNELNKPDKGGRVETPKWILLDLNMHPEFLEQSLAALRKRFPETLIAVNTTSVEKSVRFQSVAHWVDLVFTNVAEFERIWGKSQKPGVIPLGTVVMTRGSECVTVMNATECFDVPVEGLEECSNTNRAGDHFSAQIMSELLRRQVKTPDFQVVEAAIASTRQFLIRQNTH